MKRIRVLVLSLFVMMSTVTACHSDTSYPNDGGSGTAAYNEPIPPAMSTDSVKPTHTTTPTSTPVPTPTISDEPGPIPYDLLVINEMPDGEKGFLYMGMPYGEMVALLEDNNIYYDALEGDVDSPGMWVNLQRYIVLDYIGWEDDSPLARAAFYDNDNVGKAVSTALGLMHGDTVERMLELYGDGYADSRVYEHDFHGELEEYRYDMGENYLIVSFQDRVMYMWELIKKGSVYDTSPIPTPMGSCEMEPEEIATYPPPDNPAVVTPSEIITQPPVCTDPPPTPNEPSDTPAITAPPEPVPMKDDRILEIVLSDGKRCEVPLGITKDEVDAILDEAKILSDMDETITELSGRWYGYKGYRIDFSKNNSGEWVFDSYAVSFSLVMTADGLKKGDSIERIEEIYGPCERIRDDNEGGLGYNYIFDGYHLHFYVSQRDYVVDFWIVTLYPTDP